MKSSSLLAGLLALLIACGASFGAGYYIARDQAAQSPTSRPIVASENPIDEKPADALSPLEAPDKQPAKKIDDTANIKPAGSATPAGTQPDVTAKSNASTTDKPTAEAGSTPNPTAEGAEGDIPKELKDQLEDLKARIGELKPDGMEDFDDIFNGPKVDFTGTVSGMVVDANGTPVAGATVHGSYSENYNAGGESRRISFVVATGEQAGPAIATTDASGSFTATITRKVAEKASLQVSLTAGAEGYAESKKESFALKNGDTKDGVKLVLRGAGSVSGRVVDASGIGVSGVTEGLNPAGNGGFSSGLDFEMITSGGGKYSTATGSGGEFTIEGVPEGRYKFKLSGAGYRQIAGPTEIDVKSGQDQRAATDFQVAVTASLAARFTDLEGKPILGWANVNLTDDNGKIAKRLSGAISDDGSFEANDPPAGSYNVEVKVWGYKPYTARVTFIEGQRYDFGSLTLEKDENAKSGGSIFIPGEDDE